MRMSKKGYSKGGLKNGMMKNKSKFPDLSGDGEVTQKDILMGKGVVKRREGGMTPPSRMMKKKGYAKGGKVRGCGIATKGVRKAKMVTMKGS